MKRTAILIAVLALAATPALAESYYWGEIEPGGFVWIDGWGYWGEVGYWDDDYYVHVDGFGDWLWIDETGDIWVDGRRWGYMNPFGDVYSDADGFLFTIEYDIGQDEFYYDGVSAYDAQTVFAVLAIEERYFGWEVGLADVFTFNLAPDAIIQFSKDGGFDRVDFTADVLDLDGEVTDYLWEFGDGTSSTEMNPTHTYGREGKFWVSLTAWDDDGESDSAWVKLRIRSSPPKARFRRKLLHSIPGKVQFFNKSRDRDGTIVEYRWEFGDGNVSTERDPVHVYAAPGTYFVSLTVIDDDGEIGVHRKRFKVKFRG